jgi:hypothetical protein
MIKPIKTGNIPKDKMTKPINTNNIPKERVFSPDEIIELNKLQDAQHRTRN